jgi:hypothetical protein
MKPNLKLLRSHGISHNEFMKWKKHNLIPYIDPFCLEFNKGNKYLYYIGVQHTVDQGSPTYKCIRNILKKKRIDLLIIEGIPLSMGLSPGLDYFQGEGKYAVDILKGSQHDIPYTGVELDEDDLLAYLTKKFDIDDVYAFIYMRMYKYYYGVLREPKEQLDKDFEEYERPRLDGISGKVNFSIEKWFKWRIGKRFKYGSYLEYAAPSESKDAVITQQISLALQKIRDSGIILNLYKLLSDFDRVLVVYGENHVYSQLNIFEDTFTNYKLLPCL